MNRLTLEQTNKLDRELWLAYEERRKKFMEEKSIKKLDYMGWISIAMSTIPLLMQTIQAFEVPGAVGEHKKAAVLAIAIAAIDILYPSLYENDKAKLNNFLSVSIDGIVAFLNRVGVFEKIPQNSSNT